jgi:hypothetical protein
VKLFFLLLILANAKINGNLGVFGLRFSDLTGTDYSEGAIQLARSLSDRDGFPNINFLV